MKKIKFSHRYNKLWDIENGDEWIQEIKELTRMNNIPLFLKDNLGYSKIIREYPHRGGL